MDACDFQTGSPVYGAEAKELGSAMLPSSRLARWKVLHYTARPQLTAFFMSATIFASSAEFNSFNAKATGHRAPSSRLALSLKPNVAYLVLNLYAGWKKQTILPSLA